MIRAKTVILAADESGTLTTYHRGDWFKVGKQRAIELIESDQAELPEEAESQRALIEPLEDCGIYLRAGSIQDAREALEGLKLDVTEYSGALRLPYERTLIWTALRPLTRKQIALGFARVEDTGTYASWEVAAMLRAGEMLASQIGEPPEQRKTQQAIGDLRLPVYDTGALWVRKTPDTEALIAAWDAELRAGSECEEHAFLRALYQNRVLLCSLPAGWLGRWVRR